ncbi:GvpL/GvpF family gas vesicle protein [Streptomyces sp. NPDC057838]|uniref:GvpL/GvpF family gas vesicle protein n=1 Tax=unclassified Streptomyces TaxID=2593676 RepID=UPI003678465E
MSTVPAGRPPERADGPSLTCVFAVTDAAVSPEVLAGTPGHDGGGPLRVLAAGPFRLVVQDVPAAAFGEESLPERLNRPDELERCARAHHRGVAAAATTGPVVPLPLATLYRDDRNAVRAVTGREAVLRVLLDRLRDRAEWAVKVHGPAADLVPDAVDPAALRHDPGAAASTAAHGPADGRSYLRRASARRRTERETREQALARAHAVDRELRRHAVAATRHRSQSEQLTGTRVPQLLNAAYLVDDARRAEFAGAVDRLAREAAAAALEVTVSGPWIPYSFARAHTVDDAVRREVGA